MNIHMLGILPKTRGRLPEQRTLQGYIPSLILGLKGLIVGIKKNKLKELILSCRESCGTFT